MSLNSFYAKMATLLSRFESHRYFSTNHESDGSLLVDVDGDIGALDPGVGAQVSQSYVRVSGRQTAHFMSTSALLTSLCSSVEVCTQWVDSLIRFSGVCAINVLYLFCFSSSSHTVSIKCLTSFNWKDWINFAHRIPVMFSVYLMKTELGYKLYLSQMKFWEL